MSPGHTAHPDKWPTGHVDICPCPPPDKCGPDKMDADIGHGMVSQSKHQLVLICDLVEGLIKMVMGKYPRLTGLKLLKLLIMISPCKKSIL